MGRYTQAIYHAATHLARYRAARNRSILALIPSARLPPVIVPQKPPSDGTERERK